MAICWIFKFIITRYKTHFQLTENRIDRKTKKKNAGYFSKIAIPSHLKEVRLIPILQVCFPYCLEEIIIINEYGNFSGWRDIQPGQENHHFCTQNYL